MNNETVIRLRKLFDQSVTDCNATPEFGIREVIVPLPVLEKFAELIVLECVELFADDTNDHEMAHGRALRRMIKEHFGVE